MDMFIYLILSVLNAEKVKKGQIKAIDDKYENNKLPKEQSNPNC